MKLRHYLRLSTIAVVACASALGCTVGTQSALAAVPPDAAASSTTAQTVAPAPAPRAPRAPIYLTFDDGPFPAQTKRLLKVLERNGVQATFFVLGQLAAQHPEVVQMEKAAGHAIGNHTWDHRDLTRLSTSGIRRELVRGGRGIRSATGVTPRCMRPPYGATNASVRSVNRSLHLKQVLWDVDTNDWRLPSTNTLVRRLMSARPGDVVLMHDGGGSRSRSIAAVARALPRMIKRGDQFAPVQACL